MQTVKRITSILTYKKTLALCALKWGRILLKIRAKLIKLYHPVSSLHVADAAGLFCITGSLKTANIFAYRFNKRITNKQSLIFINEKAKSISLFNGLDVDVCQCICTKKSGFTTGTGLSIAFRSADGLASNGNKCLCPFYY
jgi:hypothetical protein